MARQAAELAEIARQEAEITAQELQTIQETEQTETTATEPIVEEPATPEVQQEPTIELNISGDNAVIADGTTTEEETEEE